MKIRLFISIVVLSIFLLCADNALAGQVVKTYSFASDEESWVGAVVASIINSYQAGAGNPAGSIQSRLATKNKNRNGVGYTISGITWEGLGVPAGATVDSVDGKYDWSCTEWVNAHASSNSGDLTVTDSSDTNSTTLEDAVTFSGTTAYATRNATGNVSMPSALQPSGTSIKIKLLGILRTPNTAGSSVTRQMDTVVLTINYTESGGRRIIITN